MSEVKCCKCGAEHILAELYCKLSESGANVLCEDHGYTDLYCEKCMDKEWLKW